MNSDHVRTKLIEVIEGIQTASGVPPVALTGSTCPLKDLQGFDSKIWPVAVSLLAQATGLTIPNEKNIFLSADGKERLTIDQIAAEVCKLASSAA